MASDAQSGGSPLPDRLYASQNDRQKALKHFAHAEKAAEIAHRAGKVKDFDYAIELYINGLKLWPDAVEDGLKKLSVIALVRKQVGGKPAGFIGSRKYPTNTKNQIENLSNALHLYAFDPSDIPSLETILQLAAKTHCDRVAEWIAPLLAKEYSSAKKVSANQFQQTCAALDRTADLAREFGNEAGALAIFQAYIAISQMWERQFPASGDAQRARSAAASKQAIVKGHFDKADGFTDSLKDGEAQREARDRERGVHTVDRQKELIDRAREEWQAQPQVASKLLNLVTLMTRTEQDPLENEAIEILEREYASGDQYAFKQRADDVRMKQLHRHHRELMTRAAKDDSLRPQVEQDHQRIIETETKIYEDRQQHYPTDMRVKYQLGLRYFQAARYDDAIPLFQMALMDGRTKLESMLYIGRSFYNKKFFDQAIGTLERAVRDPAAVGALSLELNYWWARALEAVGSMADARRVYGQLIQADYNFRDARVRLERLVNQEQK